MSKRILVVDDSRVSRMMVKALVQDKHGDWVVDEAANGDEARTKVGEAAYDLVTLDFNMPGMDGLTLAAKLRLAGCMAPLALMTANVQDAIRDKSQAMGVHFIKKPVTPTTVAEVMALIGG